MTSSNRLAGRLSRRRTVLAGAQAAALAGLAVVASVGGVLPGERALLAAVAVSPGGAAADAWQVVSEATGTAGMLAVCAVGVVVLVAVRFLAAAAFLLLSGLGVAALSPLLKAVVDRDRPDVVALGDGWSSSFPSGHAAMSAAVIGAVVLVVARPDGDRVRWLPVAVGVGVLLLVAASQLALARHYPSDLLGGWLLAGTWLTLLVPSGAGHPAHTPTRVDHAGWHHQDH